VRQHKAAAEWQSSRSSAAFRRSAHGRADAVEILDLPDPGSLLSRDRLRPLEPGQWGRTRPSEGQIVEDRLDGNVVYPDPPRRARSPHPADRLLARASLPMWCFLLLAAVQAYAAVVTPWASVGDLLMRLAYGCTATLLPAAVLLWRPDAWRSARLVLAGAIVWTTPPAIAGLGWSIGLRSAAVAVAVALASYIGPALLAVGLERTRRHRTMSFVDLARFAATFTALVLTFGLGQWLPMSGHEAMRPVGGLLDAFDVAPWISGSVMSVQVFCLFVFAESCLSAVLAWEWQSRLWQCASAGTALLAGASALELMNGDLATIARTSGMPGGVWDAAPDKAILVAGLGLILLAFTSPVWSDAADADGRPGAPDEVFSWGSERVVAGIDPIPMRTIVAIAAGTDHALAVDEGGRVGAWGDDSVGQTDVPRGLSNVVAVAAGNGFSLALRSDGTVTAWGACDRGQTDVPGDLAGVTAVAAGGGFALALRADGTVAAWGDDAYGATRVPPGLSGITSISAGDHHALALTRDGTVIAWGDNAWGQAAVPFRLARVKAISAGGDFSLALLADGTVAAWGDNTFGQLEVPPDLAAVASIAAGDFHAVALRVDGDVVGWGGGSRTDGEASHPWRLVDFKAVAAGERFSLAIRAA
jgi:hypothetical protein